MERKEKIQGKIYQYDDGSDFCSSRLFIQGEKDSFDLDDCLVDFQGRNVSIEIIVREL